MFHPQSVYKSRAHSRSFPQISQVAFPQAQLLSNSRGGHSDIVQEPNTLPN